MKNTKSIKSVLHDVPGDTPQKGKSEKKPSLQLYPGDWRKDPGVQALDYEHRGIWFEMLMIMHESERRGRLVLNGRPMPDEALARLLGLSLKKTQAAAQIILDYGVASRDPKTKILYCRRMVRDEKLRLIRTQCGALGGNPGLLQKKKGKEIEHLDNQNANQTATPSSSTSFSASAEEDIRNISSSETAISKDQNSLTPKRLFELWNEYCGPLMKITTAHSIPVQEKVRNLAEHFNQLGKQTGRDPGEELVKFVCLAAETTHPEHCQKINPFYLAQDLSRVDQVRAGSYAKSWRNHGEKTETEQAADARERRRRGSAEGHRVNPEDAIVKTNSGRGTAGFKPRVPIVPGSENTPKSE
jgi:hypothetical protein